MITVHKTTWRWLVFSVFLTACAVLTCAALYFQLTDAVRTNRLLINVNGQVIQSNGALIRSLQTKDAEKAAADARERARLQALRRSFLAVQAQVRQLGGSPQPLPQALKSTPESSETSTSTGAPRPSPSTAPTPRSARTPAPRPTPRRSPSSSPTPCAAGVGPICLVP